MATPDTIAAIATAPGRAAIGIVRLSGPMASRIAGEIAGKRPPARRAMHAAFRDEHGVPIDEGLLLFFPAPHSYTGEDVLELQGHGGPLVQRTLLGRCLALGARLAEPGEFTRRAFLNGKLDLAQAESVIDLIEATTEQAARSAMRSLSGEFSKQIQDLNDQLVELRALIEATLDFPEEEIDIIHRADAEARLRAVIMRLSSVVECSEQGSLLREGMRIVLAGQPNVGKSSLLNRLAREERAIVTEIPGTTRDTIREVINIEGIPLHIVDTAGLRKPEDQVEALGIGRTWRAIEEADAMVLVVDATKGETDAEHEIEARAPPTQRRIIVMNKIDLIPKPPALVKEQTNRFKVWLSAKTGEGLDYLRRALLQSAGWHGSSEGLFLARTRHLEALRLAQSHVRQANEQVERPEFLAEELRLAHEALQSILGEFTADELLGEIFGRFCIGK